jgi:hypothetical protein
MKYVIARTMRGRPTLQHLVDARRHGQTACGLDIAYWSREYQDVRLGVLLCKKCAALG